MDQAAVRRVMFGGVVFWCSSCAVLQGQPAPVTALSPSVLQGAPGVTTDTSGLGTIRITHAGSSGFVSMELSPTLSVVPCPQGGGSCVAPTEVRVRHTLSGLRQVSILVNSTCAGPTGFGFVANELFTCPVSDARLDEQNRIAVRALITLQRAVGDPTPVLNVLFNWQVDVACPAADATQSKLTRPRAACAASDVTITPSVVSNDPNGPYAKADLFGDKLRAVIRGKNLPFDIDGTPVVTLDGVYARVTSSTRDEIIVDLNGFGDLPEGPRVLEITAGGERSRTPDAFFISSIALKGIEINQGVPLKCEPRRPCVAGHPTAVRIRSECNGTKTDGTSCEVGKQAAIGAFYVTAGGSTRTLAPGAFQMPRAGSPPDVERMRQARDTGNYYFSGRTGEGALPPEGTMSVVYAIDPRNPNAALTTPPDPNKHLILKSADFVFQRSSRRIRVGMMVDAFQVSGAAPRARINPASVLPFIDYIRGAYPVTSASVEATIIPTDLSFSPPNSADGPVDTFIAGIMRPMFHSLPLDYLIFLTANPALQTPGASDCGTGWISHWRCLSGAFMAKLNGAETMKAIAHEIGHNHMLGDSYSADREHDPQVNAGLPMQKEPRTLCEFFHDGCPAQLNHMDLLTREVSLGPPFTLPITDFGTQQRLVKRDFMGNASRAHSWTNQFNWNHLYDNYYMTDAGQQDALEPAPSGQLLDVSGSIGRDGAVEFYSISRREGAAPELPAGAESPYVVEIQNGASEPLFSAPMDVIVTFADRNPATSRIGFRELIPLPSGAARVVIKKDGGVIGSREISPNTPGVGFVSPSAGASLDGLVTIRWAGSDADNNKLTYSLFYSSDGGNIWAPLVMGTDSDSYAWDTAAWPGGSNLMLRVAASDGVNSAEATLSGLRLPAKAPQIAIVTPVDGAALNKADQPELSVSVWDPQEGVLDPDLVVIRSDRDGEIAKGLSADLSRLSVGRHRITVAATNRSNLTGEAAITVTISGGAAGSPPVIAAAPAEIDFGSVTQGQSATRSAAIRNDGGTRLTVSQINVPGPAFSLTATGIPWILEPGQSREYQVRFSPTGAGRLTALVSITSDDPARRTITVALTGTGVATTGGGVGGTLEPITPLRARGWPNERTFDNPPPNAVDGNTNTFTWTSNPNNIASPSYFGVDFGASKPVSRIRLYKDNDGGGGTLSDHFKNLVIEYTTTNASTPLPERTWTRVTGLANGFNGTELLVASAVNSDGTVTRDSHNSANSGWASLTFNSVNATGVRIGFNNTTSQTFFNHYKVHEFEAYGSGGGGGTASPSIDVSQRIVDFGVVAVGETADRTINIRNSGAATRNVTGITIDDTQFTRVQPGVPFAIGAGSFQNLQIRFTPRAGGPQNALLTITTDDPARPGVTVIVTGVGRATQQPALGFEPPALSFLASEAGQTKTVRATNLSSVPLLIVDITSSNPSFVVSLNAISTGGTNAVNVPVRFMPTGSGTHRGTIRIVTDPPAPTAQFTVTGEGPAVPSSPVRVTIASIAGWPNGRLSNNLPANAIDGSTASFTWTTESFNSVNPSYLGIGFAASTGVNRIRLFKDNNAGGPGLIAKNLVIEYSTSPVSTPLSSRTWTPVTGLTNGSQGAENMVASGVNANGTVLADNHDSAVHGWASLTFNAVNATAIRIGFSNATPISVNHYRVYEFEAYGPAATQR